VDVGVGFADRAAAVVAVVLGENRAHRT